MKNGGRKIEKKRPGRGEGARPPISSPAHYETRANFRACFWAEDRLFGSCCISAPLSTSLSPLCLLSLLLFPDWKCIIFERKTALSSLSLSNSPRYCHTDVSVGGRDADGHLCGWRPAAQFIRSAFLKLRKFTQRSLCDVGSASRRRATSITCLLSLLVSVFIL